MGEWSILGGIDRKGIDRKGMGMLTDLIKYINGLLYLLLVLVLCAPNTHALLEHLPLIFLFQPLIEPKSCLSSCYIHISANPIY